MFNGLREGSPIYILHKGDKDNNPKLRIAYVTKKGEPITITGAPAINFGMPMETYVDIEAQSQTDGQSYKFDKLPSNDSVRQYPNENTILTDSREIAIQEVENMNRLSSQVLETVPYHQSVVEAREEMMCLLNPQFAKEKEQEQKIGMLETKICGVESTLCNIQDMLAKALNTTGGSRKSSNTN